MKLLLAVLALGFCISCNNNSHATSEADTTKAGNIDQNALRNNMPMRTTDTSTNIMMDTMDHMPK